MTFADRMKILGFLLCGALMAATGMPLVILGGYFSAFPWNIVSIVVGALIAWGGAKLFLKAF